MVIILAYLERAIAPSDSKRRGTGGRYSAPLSSPLHHCHYKYTRSASRCPFCPALHMLLGVRRAYALNGTSISSPTAR
jgi:hypothetical protein